MPPRPVTRVTGCDGSEMGCCANFPFARHRAAPPDAWHEGFLSNPRVRLAWALTFAPVRFSYVGSGTDCRGWDAVNPAKCPKRSIPVSPCSECVVPADSIAADKRTERLLVHVVAT